MLSICGSIDVDAFNAWLRDAPRGACIAYHRGLLGRDVSVAALERCGPSLSNADRRLCAVRAKIIRGRVQWAAGMRDTALGENQSAFHPRLRRRVTLLQQRIAENDYLYIAQALSHANIDGEV